MTQTFEPRPAVLAGAAPEVCELPATTLTESGELLEDTRDFTHNPAPWYALYSLGQGNTRIYSARAEDRGRLLATVVHFTPLLGEDSCANGRVMAAAPLLLDALAAILTEWGETETLTQATVQRATRAIVAAVDGYEAAEALAAMQTQAQGCDAQTRSDTDDADDAGDAESEAIS